MNAGIRTRKRLRWPIGLEQTPSGKFRWKPPAKMRPLITATIPAGGFPLESSTLADAIAEVEEVYRVLAPLRTQRTLLESVTIGPDTVADWIPTYLDRVRARKVSAATHGRIRRAVEAFSATHGHLSVSAIGTRHVADYLATISSATMRAKARTALQDCFREAITAGWIDRNPASDTRAPTPSVKRARLSVDEYRRIHAWSAENQPSWATRSIEMALVTAQRRSDIAAMRFADVVDGYLRVKPIKTRERGTKLAIPLGLRIDVMGWTVGETIARCRDITVSHFMIHHPRTVGRARAGDPVVEDRLSEVFAEARIGAGVAIRNDHPPTFHEIRSLALRLYAEQGVNVQALAGHKDPAMTAIYTDARGSEWIKVSMRN